MTRAAVSLRRWDDGMVIYHPSDLDEAAYNFVSGKWVPTGVAVAVGGGPAE